MPRVATAICEECGNSYIMNLDDCKIPEGMSVKIRKQGAEKIPIKTWGDWVNHISTHCPQCRFQEPPFQAKLDHEKYLKDS